MSHEQKYVVEIVVSSADDGSVEALADLGFDAIIAMPTEHKEAVIEALHELADHLATKWT
jgi:hypothetical protein